MEETGEEAGTQNERTLSDAEKQELQKLLASVIHKRKTVPTKCMKLYREINLKDITNLERTEIKLKEDKNHKSFMKLVDKLVYSKPPKVTLDDLKEVEGRLLKCQQKLKDLNAYFKKRRQFNQ